MSAEAMSDNMFAKRETEKTAFFVEKSLKSHKNPLVWWKYYHSLSSRIAHVARAVLAVLATSATSERLLTQAGLIMPDKRNRLALENIEQLMFLRGTWLKIEYFRLKNLNIQKK